jgi:tRNA G18 (ribose-2'-O)-methylase SpoU
VDWEYNEDVIKLTKSLKKNGYKIIAIEQADESCYLDNFVPDHSKMALIFGNEVTGVKDEIIELADNVVEIRQYGTKHSLNISVSIGIVVWDILAKRKIQKD